MHVYLRIGVEMLLFFDGYGIFGMGLFWIACKLEGEKEKGFMSMRITKKN